MSKRNSDAAKIESHLADVERARAWNRIAAQAVIIPTSLPEFIAWIDASIAWGAARREMRSQMGFLFDPNRRDEGNTRNALQAADMARGFGVSPLPNVPARPISYEELDRFFRELHDAAMSRAPAGNNPPAKMSQKDFAAIAKLSTTKVNAMAKKGTPLTLELANKLAAEQDGRRTRPKAEPTRPAKSEQPVITGVPRFKCLKCNKEFARDEDRCSCGGEIIRANPPRAPR